MNDLWLSKHQAINKGTIMDTSSSQQETIMNNEPTIKFIPSNDGNWGSPVNPDLVWVGNFDETPSSSKEEEESSISLEEAFKAGFEAAYGMQCDDDGIEMAEHCWQNYKLSLPSAETLDDDKLYKQSLQSKEEKHLHNFIPGEHWYSDQKCECGARLVCTQSLQSKEGVGYDNE